MYFELMSMMKRTLGQLDKWLELAESYAKTKSFDSKNLLSARLFPDMLDFTKQVQIACDTAKLSTSRLTGKDAPKHADDETTVEHLRARVRSTLEFLNGFTAKDFEGAGTRTINNPRWEGRTMDGQHYFLEHAVPNFFFHVNMTYALLRHAGVGLGKQVYLGELSFK